MTHLSKKYRTDLIGAMHAGVADILREFDLRRTSGRKSLSSNEFWALNNVSFEVHPGQALGVVGHNGAGKSTLLRLLHGLIKPDHGKVRIQGRTAAMIELGASFSGLLTGRENVRTEAVLLGLGRRDQGQLIDAVEEFADIGSFFDAPVETYSNGMQMRLGYAIAAELQPALLLIDEVITVGDLRFQRKCLKHIHEFLGSGGALVLVSHDLWMLNAVCSESIELNQGQIVARGPTSEVTIHYTERMKTGIGLQSENTPPSKDSSDVQAVKPAQPHPGAFDELGPELAFKPQTPAVGRDIAVTELSILHGNGGPPRWNESAVVRLGLWSNDEAPRSVQWSIAIIASNQQLCIASLAASDSPVADVELGYSTHSLEIERWPLVVGNYHIQACLLDTDSGDLLNGESNERLFPLRVDSSGSFAEATSQVLACLSLSYQPWVEGSGISIE